MDNPVSERLIVAWMESGGILGGYNKNKSIPYGEDVG
jgi:hypothetical protein